MFKDDQKDTPDENGVYVWNEKEEITQASWINYGTSKNTTGDWKETKQNEIDKEKTQIKSERDLKRSKAFEAKQMQEKILQISKQA